jgi:hypothetical protein
VARPFGSVQTDPEVVTGAGNVDRSAQNAYNVLVRVKDVLYDTQ